MKITIAFLAGLATGLVFAAVPSVRWFRDQPESPEGWEPKYRRWVGGEEIPWTLKN